MPNVADLDWMPGRWTRFVDVAREDDVWWVCFPCQDAMDATAAHSLQLNDWREDHAYCECRTLSNWVKWSERIEWLTGSTDNEIYYHSIGQRRGQFYFNVLRDYHPLLAEKIRGSIVDPFNRDERIPAFLAFVDENWETV